MSTRQLIDGTKGWPEFVTSEHAPTKKPKKPKLVNGTPKSRLKAKLRKLIERHDGKCHWCKRLCDASTVKLQPTQDHLIKKAHDGRATLHNLVLACKECNSGRHAPNWKPKK